MSNGFRIDHDAIEDIAKTTMQDIHDTARTQTQSFRNSSAHKGSYGDVEQAQVFADEEAAALEIFDKTIQGVLADLATFQDNLLASSKAHRDNDENHASDFGRLGDVAALQSQRNYNRTGKRKSKQLNLHLGQDSWPGQHGHGSGAHAGHGDGGTSAPSSTSGDIS